MLGTIHLKKANATVTSDLDGRLIYTTSQSKVFLSYDLLEQTRQIGARKFAYDIPEKNLSTIVS